MRLISAFFLENIAFTRYNILRKGIVDARSGGDMNAKKSIQKAFRALLKEYALDRITVTLICEKANVNRQTFYYYYQNIIDLLKDILFVEIYDEVNRGRAYDTWKHGFLTTTRFIHSNHEMFMNIYTSSYWEEVNRYFTEISNTLLLGVLDECIANTDSAIREEDKHFMVEYYRIVFNGIMTEWTKAGMTLTPEELLSKFEKMVDGTICMSLERFAQPTVK